MADISSYLAAIMSAVYGEDVRGSIHDAIEIINDVSEVVLTTGTAITGPTSSSTGFYRDSLYLNTSTMELWKCVGTNSWASQGNLKGADGNGIASIAKTSTAGLVDTYTITFDDGNTETFDITNGADGQNGSKWYKGTAISGTGTSITGFPGVVNDFYLNSSTGYVYTCTKTGGSLVPDAAEWDYVMALTGGGGGSTITVIDALNSTSSTDALSANQGRVLKGLVDAKQDVITASTSSGLTITSAGAISCNFGNSAFAVAEGNHTHYTGISAIAGTASLTMQPGGKYELTSGGTTKTFQIPDSSSEWHKVNGSIQEFTISTTDTSKTFTNLNTNYGYKPFIQVADGEDPLPYTNMVFSGTDCTVSFNSPSAAQAAGNACKICLRAFK